MGALLPANGGEDKVDQEPRLPCKTLNNVDYTQ